VKAQILPAVQFAFKNEQSRGDKLRGLVEFGPYKDLPGAPVLGFVFPDEYRDQANRLYLSLKNGIGSFKGVATTFRFPLSKEQVFNISGFSIRGRNPSEAARLYEDAILKWIASGREPRPDLFFVLHPQTPHSEVDTPYYACKARLLTEGILSQNATIDLISDESRLRWSAANIALGAFVKLGGVPWIIYGKELSQELIVGIGKSYLYDPQTRQTVGFVGFTACFSARGRFEFLTLAELASNREEFLRLLGEVISSSLQKAEALGRSISSLTLHVPKEMGRQEMEAINRAVDAHKRQNIVQIFVTKVSEEETYFALDTGHKDGVPKRGTVIRLSDKDYLLYTEGREEKEPWLNFRSPVALRVTPLFRTNQSVTVQSVLRQVHDLSQVNWRGFNARSKPISTYYGRLIAEILCHVPASRMRDLSTEAKDLLEKRMWFI